MQGTLLAASAASLLSIAVAHRLGESARGADSAQHPVATVSAVTDGATTNASPPQRFAMDATTHGRVEIIRPPEAIWPHILHPNAWTPHDLVHRSGPKGEVGEIFAVVNPAQPETVRTFAENVELIRNQRRTFKLYDRNGRLSGYVIWTLQAGRDRTVVSYDLYYESILSRNEVLGANTASTLAERRQAQLDEANRRIESSLSALKRLAEASP